MKGFFKGFKQAVSDVNRHIDEMASEHKVGVEIRNIDLVKRCGIYSSDGNVIKDKKLINEILECFNDVDKFKALVLKHNLKADGWIVVLNDQRRVRSLLDKMKF